MTRRLSYPGGGVELRQDEEHVLLPRVQSSVLEAPVVQLVPQGEEGWQGGGCEAGGDVRPTQVRLLLLPRVLLLLTDVFQQLSKSETQRCSDPLPVTHVDLYKVTTTRRCFYLFYFFILAR